MPSRAISGAIPLGNLSSIRLSGPFSRNVSKKKKKQRVQKAAVVAALGNRKIRSTYAQAPPSICSVRALLSWLPTSTCAVTFTRPSDTTRLLARLVRLGHPLGHRPPVTAAGPLCACEKRETDTDRFVPCQCFYGSHMKFPNESNRSQRHTILALQPDSGPDVSHGALITHPPSLFSDLTTNTRIHMQTNDNSRTVHAQPCTMQQDGHNKMKNFFPFSAIHMLL